MSEPNPQPRYRRYHRRWYAERIWREFFCACIAAAGDRVTGSSIYVKEAALDADIAYREYQNRFPPQPPADEGTDDETQVVEPKPQ